MSRHLPSFFRDGGRIAWATVAVFTAVWFGTGALVRQAAEVRYRRDVTRMVYNDNLDLLDDIRRSAGLESDSLEQRLASTAETPGDQPYIVVSIEDHRLWYKQADHVLFTTQVATGSGKVLVKDKGARWKFETPRGRLVVQSKEVEPSWIPPDWHFIEMAKKKGLGTVRLLRGEALQVGDSTELTVVGNDVVRKFPDGHTEALEVKEGHEIVAQGNIVIPPFGTTQRKYVGVLGTQRLYLGDGYGIHGTDEPASIGHSVSHGCVRVRNEDIETLYRMVPVGTPVYIY
jgi:L,D-transpeptidase catalytic domain